MSEDSKIHRNTVIVVEDEPAIRVLIGDVLVDAGFDVIAKPSAEEALKVLEIRHDDVGVLFTDINVPGSLDGLQLAHLVNTSWPHITIIVSSGREAISRSNFPEDCYFLTKPYDFDLLVKQVRTILLPEP